MQIYITLCCSEGSSISTVRPLWKVNGQNSLKLLSRISKLLKAPQPPHNPSLVFKCCLCPPPNYVPSRTGNLSVLIYTSRRNKKSWDFALLLGRNGLRGRPQPLKTIATENEVLKNGVESLILSKSAGGQGTNDMVWNMEDREAKSSIGPESLSDESQLFENSYDSDVSSISGASDD